MRNAISVKLFALCMLFAPPSLASDAIENWRFTWTLYEDKGSAVYIESSEDGTSYRVKSSLSSMGVSADDAEGIGAYLTEVLAKPEEEIPEGKKVIGSRVVDIKRKDGALRFMISEDRDVSFNMAFFNIREIKKVAAAFGHAKERIKLVADRMKIVTAAQ